MEQPSTLTQTHIPVLLREVLQALNIQSGKRYVDATVGGAGHAVAIMKASAPDGKLLGLDRDLEAAERAAERLAPFGKRAQVAHENYEHLEDIVKRTDFFPADGVFFDLGFSSWHIDKGERGFSFRHDGPLDMRFDTTSHGLTADEIVNQWPETELIHILRKYGEEIHSRRIAQAIVTARPIHRTTELAQVIASAVGNPKGKHIHPATRTFQALRIAVNDELETLARTLPKALHILYPGGRLAVITFHSLEDRIVKHFFQQEERECICPPESPICTCEHTPTVKRLTRKPITPSAEEVQANPRSRSAKLRVVEKLGTEHK